ncbi:hypothetical protein [Bythopirellula polymerisocia]|uniref:Alpha/beta hydrolase family protein n=1 Tax=Bythopirellula polymerisocia TaxID=2528003 RepID=A0A5C6CXU7_9BACT|nr:hypothetical protein [Bythopirellula polymerisocia]TWU29370.1 hypothetical protein Pla144_01460 [Bythopirellula polymerisocia]
MRQEIHFRHQPYRSTLPVAPYQLVPEPEEVDPSSADYTERLAASCAALTNVNLAATYLVHGTFIGNDVLGLLTELRRCSPWLSERVRQATRGMVNCVAGETGNYTSQFAATFQQGIAVGAGRESPVRLFQWSGQNNHIARADGAVGLICNLASLAESLSDATLISPNQARVMLWGHSHGGNVLALLTSLLAADREARQKFFEAARIFFTPWWGKSTDMPTWVHAEQVLEDADHPLRNLALDIATFGTPIRYGWHGAGYNNLLHFVNHRPKAEVPAHKTRHPLHLPRFLKATDGDYIHQLGIAGTNLMPNPLAVRTLLADLRLKKVLEHDLQPEWRLQRWSRGHRIPDEGTTLLVDYHDSHWYTPYHLAGHGTYTRSKWLPFHVTEIARQFYSAKAVV